MIKENLATFDTTNISVKMGGRRYSFWKSAQIHIAMGEFAREVTLDVSDGDAATSAAGNLLMDSPVSIICDDITVLTGYIDNVSVKYDKSSHGITIRARSKTCDLVDCSFMGDAQFDGESARGVIERICAPFGIRVIWKCADWVIGEINTSVGDTCAAIISEICKRGGVFYTDDAAGNLIITDLKTTAAVATLYNPPNDVGSNILSGTVNYSSRDRFSEYTVESQIDFGGYDVSEFAYISSATARDPGVKRYRPKRVIAETAQDSAADESSAELEYMAATAAAAEFEYKINGWKDANGEIWRAGALVTISDAMAHVNNQLIVKAADLSISNDGGRVTSLKLCYPNAMIKNYVPKTRIRDPWYYNGREV